jgi:hypothetical protein
MVDTRDDREYEGTIAYCSREREDCAQFAACLARLAQQHPTALVTHIISNDIAHARNQAVMNARGGWIWFIDTDMVFGPDTLKRLLRHNVDIVQVHVVMRHPPHETVLWEHDPVKKDGIAVGPPRLVEVQSLGAGGTLYRQRVFESMPGPWFEGILGREDTCFAQKARDAGFPLHVDLATPVGHIAPVAIWPKYHGDGTWAVKYQAVNGAEIEVPGPATPRVLVPR